MCGGHTGHGQNTSYRGPFIRSCSPTIRAAIFMIAASSVKLPRHFVFSVARGTTTSLIKCSTRPR